MMVQHHCRGCESAQHVKADDALCPWSHLWSPLKLSMIGGGSKSARNAIPSFGRSRGDQPVTSSRFRDVVYNAPR
jgi:hypothetical protein